MQKFLDAHLEFEMRQWASEESVRRTVSELAAAFGKLKIKEVASRNSIEFVIAELRAARPSENTKSFFRESVKRLRSAAAGSTETTDSLTTKEIHNEWVDVLIESEELRMDVARDFARSLFFKRLMSEILYYTLKRFVSEDNAFAKSIPGMSSLFKLGQNLVSQAIPNLDENLSRIVREFIGRNMESVAKYAETVLTTQMDEKLIRELADGFWDDLAKRPISRLAHDLEPLQGREVGEALEASWNHFKDTALFDELVRTLLESWFDHYENMEIQAVLAELGFDQDRAADTAYKFMAPGLKAALETGTLRGVIQSRLASFYASVDPGLLG